MWHEATRGLFGDECLSLRHVQKLQEIVQNISTPPSAALATFFLGKVPALGNFMVTQFVNCLLNFYAMKLQGQLKLPPDTPFNSPVQLLIQTALLSASNDIASYPEFTRMLKGAMKVHPLLRLVAWVKRVHIELDLACPPLDCLLQLKVIDQIGFPLVLGIGSTPSSLRHCDAFAQKGDYSNLLWILSALTHGYSVWFFFHFVLLNLLIYVYIVMLLTGMRSKHIGNRISSPIPSILKSY